MSEERPAEFEGRIEQGKDWREIVAWVGDLPPMPNVASRAMTMVENPDTTAQELSDLLSTDTALAARVLKIANSAMFSRQREITTLNQAIMIIGYKALKGIIVAAALRQLNKKFGKLEKLIWENSMCTAMGSTLIAKKLSKNYVDEIFLLGLLHSLGQIVFLVNTDTAKQYEDVLSLIRDEGLGYAAAEQKVFGFAHPLVGALVAKKWNFSTETCQTILHYRDPIETKPETPLEEKTAIVQMADLITHAAGIGSPEGYPESMEEIKRLALLLGFEKDSLDEKLEAIINGTQERFQEESSVYS
ncbi:MAG: HDOD domain-containing protein [Bdellovibrionota bacterium]